LSVQSVSETGILSLIFNRSVALNQDYLLDKLANT